MPFLEEAGNLGKRIMGGLYLFAAALGFFFVFGLKKVILFGYQLSVPWPSFNSFSNLLLKKMQSDLLAGRMKLIVINPLDALWAQLSISLFLALLVSLPFLLYRVIGYFTPALYLREKKTILKAVIPSVILFLSGAALAYFFLIPMTFDFLYEYILAIQVQPFFAVNEFISLVLIFTFATGLFFLLPVFMVLLTYLRLVSPETWLKHWRIAILFFLILSAIITPDGTGITMALLAVPLTGLYFSGCAVSQRIKASQTIL
jgi:sec-independent protein translocase protein TatC